MKINGLSWLGTRTNKFADLCDFYENTMGLIPMTVEEHRRVYRLDDGSAIAVFDEELESHQHFTTGPVVGLLVDNVEEARANMEAKGVEFLSPVLGTRGESRWSQFRGPDGNVYEIIERG